MKTPRSEVYAALDSERAYQDMRWGGSRSSGEQGAGERTLDEFALYIYGYAHLLMQFAAVSLDPIEKLNLMRKVGGLVVSAMEQHGAPRRESF